MKKMLERVKALSSAKPFLQPGKYEEKVLESLQADSGTATPSTSYCSSPSSRNTSYKG